jgi:hypothetical protein
MADWKKIITENDDVSFTGITVNEYLNLPRYLDFPTAIATEGDIIYLAPSQSLYFYDGVNWKKLFGDPSA